MIVVTGAAGFIGSCIVSSLNAQGAKDLILVDHIDDPKKDNNLSGKLYTRYLDKKEFLGRIRDDVFDGDVRAVIHMGACSSTTLQDEQYFQENNFEYSKIVAQWAVNRKIRLIYASSAATYGDGSVGYRDDELTVRRCKPLNLYGESKQKFDLWVLEQGLQDRVVGLKFFNVFGPNEYHKGDMRSVVAKAYEQVVREGDMSLFKSYKPEFADGEQKRDFIYVKDAVAIVLYFLDHPEINGIFNAGTGKARTWNDLAKALFTVVGKPPRINYIEMPDLLKSKYQYYTEADMDKLRSAGYTRPFIELEDAVRDYAGYLSGRCYF